MSDFERLVNSVEKLVGLVNDGQESTALLASLVTSLMQRVEILEQAVNAEGAGDE